MHFISARAEGAGTLARHTLADGFDLVFDIERSHGAWLHDARAGRVRNQITQGDWVVRRVVRLDAERRQIWFQALGVRPGQDPYQTHLCRVNLDGSGLLVLTLVYGLPRIIGTTIALRGFAR